MGVKENFKVSGLMISIIGKATTLLFSLIRFSKFSAQAS